MKRRNNTLYNYLEKKNRSTASQPNRAEIEELVRKHDNLLENNAFALFLCEKDFIEVRYDVEGVYRFELRNGNKSVSAIDVLRANFSNHGIQEFSLAYARKVGQTQTNREFVKFLPEFVNTTSSPLQNFMKDSAETTRNLLFFLYDHSTGTYLVDELLSHYNRLVDLVFSVSARSRFRTIQVMAHENALLAPKFSHYDLVRLTDIVFLLRVLPFIKVLTDVLQNVEKLIQRHSFCIPFSSVIPNILTEAQLDIIEFDNHQAFNREMLLDFRPLFHGRPFSTFILGNVLTDLIGTPSQEGLRVYFEDQSLQDVIGFLEILLCINDTNRVLTKECIRLSAEFFCAAYSKDEFRGQPQVRFDVLPPLPVIQITHIKKNDPSPPSQPPSLPTPPADKSSSSSSSSDSLEKEQTEIPLKSASNVPEHQNSSL